MLEKIEWLCEAGGTKRALAVLVVSACALVASFVWAKDLPVDPAWAAIVLCGLPIVCEAIVGLVTEFDITADVLVAIALVASVTIGELFAAGEVAAIMALGELLEDLTVARARRGIEALVELTPRVARVVEAGGAAGVESEIAADQVRAGQVVRVLPGETIPVDGIIVRGATSVDESLVTGESMPCDKQVGSEVASGTVNQFGSIDVQATRAGDDGTIQRMIALVNSADAGKAKIVRLADRWAKWLVAASCAVALAAFFVTGEAVRAVTVLVVFCPCSLVLATPTAIMAAIGNATKHGFLVKEGDALERLARVGCVAFDKTGTLTMGKAVVSGIRALPASGLSPEALLSLAAAAESRSEHPLGAAVVARAQATGHSLPRSEGFQMTPGQGVEATVAGQRVAVGNLALMEAQGLAPAAWDAAMPQELLDEGRTVAFVAVDGRAAGLVALADELRATSRATIARLKADGVEPVMLTGDNRAAAARIAGEAGVDSVVADCRPEDKLAFVEAREQGRQGTAESSRLVAMVGDGINDAPALKRAFVGIAMGGVGSDVAVDAADIVIVEDDIDELPHLLALARKTMRTIRANLAFSLVLNFLAVALALVAVLNPVTGALVHNCGSVFVVANSALLLTWKRPTATSCAKLSQSC